jgi:outer membrane protein OmpA-like peptidoglycan-associated protein
MTNNIKPKKQSAKRWLLNNISFKLLSALILIIAIQMPTAAQEKKFTAPSWWFGVAGGANFNYYQGTTQQLNQNFRPPVAFHDGDGAGVFGAALVEYHRPKSVFGFMLQAGYDDRTAKFDQVISACNCPADLETKLGYITVEPSLRIAPFKSNFYIFGGPRFAFNVEKNFKYKLGINPNFPQQPPSPEVKGEFSETNSNIISMQAGAGIDIPLSNGSRQTQFMLSPFVSFHPYFGQNPRSTEDWKVTTLRVGAALKFGNGTRIAATVKPPVVDVLPVKQPDTVAVVVVPTPDVVFTVNAPKNIPTERRVREVFPLRNYVFFDLGSTKIPERYVLLEKNQVKDFKEDQLELFRPKNLSGRSERQMIVYYNVLNILGDRMGKNKNANINLVGSSEKGPADGKLMSEEVKNYLVTIFGISASRISTEGNTKPNIPSEQSGGTKDLVLLREGDRRVSIESASADLLMEFQMGPNSPLKPIEIVGVQDAPLDSYVSFNNAGASKAFSSWKMEIKDNKGVVQYFGPYTQEYVTIPGKTILGTRPEADFTIKMIGRTMDNKIVTKETTAHMVLWTPSTLQEGMRFSVIYEFNESKAIGIYEKYLTEIVAPKVADGATVIIHGHTDIIGDNGYNEKLSMARANDVKTILKNSLVKMGRNNVKYELYGFGEDENLSPFENNFPEQRFYNRTVIIDIIPVK